MNPTHIKTVQVELIIHSYQGQEPMNIYLKLSVFIIRIKQSKFKILRFWDFFSFFFFLFSIDTITWVKQKVWSFDSISTVFLLSFLGFGFTFHRFLGNQTEIENSRERERPVGRWHRRCEAWGGGGGEEGRIGEPRNRLRTLLAPPLLLPQLPLLRRCCLPLFSERERERDVFFPLCFGRERIIRTLSLLFILIGSVW